MTDADTPEQPTSPPPRHSPDEASSELALRDKLKAGLRQRRGEKWWAENEKNLDGLWESQKSLFL